MKDKIVELAIGAFMSLGGVGLIIHAATKYAPDQLKFALGWLMTKYPPLKKFVADHAPDLIAFAQAIEKAEEEAINAAKDDIPPPPNP